MRLYKIEYEDKDGVVHWEWAESRMDVAERLHEKRLMPTEVDVQICELGPMQKRREVAHMMNNFCNRPPAGRYD